jgi:CRP/FNR family transcriptional regulator, nitrogen fixation regulation protein
MLRDSSQSLLVEPAGVGPTVAIPTGWVASRSLGGAIKPVRSYERDTEIFSEGKPADYMYSVVRGSVRTQKVFPDGRREIIGFYLPGDVFGLEFADTYNCSAETITDTMLHAISRSTFAQQADHDPAIARDLLALTARELKRAQFRALLLAKTAQERVASFLVEMADRGAGGDAIDLPMSRQDVADHLGLSIETVSRTLVFLEKNSTIRVSLRRIVLRDRSVLESISSPR